MFLKSSHIMKRIVFLIFFSLFLNFVSGQDTVLMGTSGHQEIISNYCVVYADNGPGQNHSPRVNSSYTIKATDSTYNCKIIVHSEYEYYINPNNCYTIYKGDTNSQDRILKSAHDVYYEYIMYTNTDEVTIDFYVDNDNPVVSFEIIIQFCDCEAPSDVTHEYIDSTSVMLHWNGHGYSSFAIDYILFPPPATGKITYFNHTFANLNGYNDGTIHTVYTDADSILITGLPPYSFIHYHVYGSCDSVPMCGVLGNTDCRNFMPENIEVTYDDDSIYVTWDSVPGANWYIRDNTNYSYHSTSNGNSHALPKICNATAWGDITGGYGAFYDCNIDYKAFNEYFGCPYVYGEVTDIDYNSMRVYWHDVDSVEQYLVVCTYDFSPYDTVFYDTIPSGVEEVIIEGLEEATDYKISLHTLCDECGKSKATNYYENTTLNRCIDYINIYSDRSHPTAGNYDDPYMWNNYFRGNVFLNKTSTDYYTNSLLKQVPEGEKASVRLGNSSTGAEAESISYDYSVDTNEFDMLTLKYAVVLQNPDHTLENQPRFTLEILDEDGVLIDSTCAFADFYASGDLGWNQNTYNNSTIIWKDWTTVGVDIAPYHGEDIKIRLTTYDCKDGGHFGYAYFTLNCDKKKIYLYNPCDAIDSVHLRAPLGFEYKWYREGDTTVLSTNYDILVPIDSNEYFCTASFVGKPECNFTISSHSISIYPKAEANLLIDTCNSMAYLSDLSYMILDTSYNVFTNHVLDTSFWILENDSILYVDSIMRFFPNNGTYNIQLVSSITDSYCMDTLTIPVNIDFNLLAGINGPDTVCQGDTVILSASFVGGVNSENIDYLWNNGEISDSMVFVAEENVEFNLNISENESCRGKGGKAVVVNPSYYDTIYASICDNQVYNDGLFNVDSTGVYTWFGNTNCSCDSLITLILTVYPTFDTLIYDTICEGQIYHSYNFYVDSAGSYTQYLQSINGCDSIVRLNLVVLPIHNISISAEICDGDVYSLYGFEETETGVYVHNEENVYGCDSVFTLNLNVNPVYDYTINAEICQGETYSENNFSESETGVYTQHLQTEKGCDSIVSLDLFVNPIYNDTIFTELCGEAYSDNGFYEDSTGFYTQYLQTEKGCDSVVNLDLVVFDVFVDTVKAEIYKGDVYEKYGFNETETGEYMRVFVDANGCDSVYVLFLDVIHLNIPNMVSANGDGINDVFEIIGLLNNNYFSFTELAIYNRHGRRIYYNDKFEDMSDFWSPAETNSPEGTYFYNFRAKGKTREFEKTGAIEVLR